MSIGEGLEITLDEPDRNLDSEAYDTVNVTVNGITVVLNETGPNTGIFKNDTLVVGSDLAFAAGESFDISYTDDATADSTWIRGFVSTTLTQTVSIISHTAEVVMDKTEYGPYDIVYVNVTDPDLYFNTTSEIYITFVSSLKLAPGVPVYAYDKVDSTFMFKFALELDTNVTSPDTIYVFYVDEKDETGKTLTIIKTADVFTATGEVVMDKDLYNVGEYITINVTDPDRNTDSTLRESVQVLVKSTTYPLGINVTLLETLSLIHI